MKLDLVADGLKETKRAKATVEGDGISGTAQFIEYQVDDFSYVKVILDLKGDTEKLKPGKHAVHIHEKADCSGGFKCAGGHFDPGPAGNTDPDVNHPFHAGDLPNITINDKGEGHLEAITNRVTLSKGPKSLLDAPEGTSLMVHGNPDPYEGGESGSGVSGGPRIVCGIIEAA
jgi:Cu-Zn family superoxide dismutase